MQTPTLCTLHPNSHPCPKSNHTDAQTYTRTQTRTGTVGMTLLRRRRVHAVLTAGHALSGGTGLLQKDAFADIIQVILGQCLWGCTNHPTKSKRMPHFLLGNRS